MQRKKVLIIFITLVMMLTCFISAKVFATDVILTNPGRSKSKRFFANFRWKLWRIGFKHDIRLRRWYFCTI